MTMHATPEEVKQALKEKGFAHYQIAHHDSPSFDELAATFATLSIDGSRRRSYGRHLITPRMRDAADLDLNPTSMFYLGSDYQQSGDVNPEQQGAIRNFAALPQKAYSCELLRSLVWSDFNALPLTEFWFNAKRNPIQAGIHLVRMCAKPDEPGVSTPNRPHQDGEPCTMIHLIHRHAIVGGESRIFESVKDEQNCSKPGRLLFKTELTRPLETIAVWDRSVFHHVTSVNVMQGAEEGYRDVILIDFTPLETVVCNSKGEFASNPMLFKSDIRTAA